MPAPSVVPDVNVLVSAAINRSSPPGRIRVTWRRQELMFVTSPATIRRVHRVSGDAHLKRLGQYEHIPILSPAEFVEQYAIPS